jgi:hypothetical protein
LLSVIYSVFLSALLSNFLKVGLLGLLISFSCHCQSPG